MKYNIFLSTEILVRPANTTIQPNGTEQMVALLREGYEIYSAIVFSTGEVAGIRYIIRKPVEMEKEGDKQ